MRVLLVGGSGHVGSMTLPYLKTHHACRVLDLQPPGDDSVEFIQGSVTDPQAVQRAVEGMDTFIYMVMQHPDASLSASAGGIVGNYQVNLLGLHLVLQATKDAGIQRGVYTSTMTVHERTRNRFPSEEEVPLDNERDCFIAVAKSLDPKWSRQLTKEFKSSLKGNWPDSEVKDLSKEISSIADLLYAFFRNTMIHGYRSRAVYLTENETDSWKQEEGYLILNPYWFWEAFKRVYVSLFEEVEKGQESNPQRRNCTAYIDKMLK